MILNDKNSKRLVEFAQKHVCRQYELGWGDYFGCDFCGVYRHVYDTEGHFDNSPIQHTDDCLGMDIIFGGINSHERT